MITQIIDATLSFMRSELPRQLSLDGGFNCSDRAFGGRPSTLAVGNDRFPAVRTCRADCLTCSAIIGENEFVSSTTGRKYFVTDIKPDEVYHKLQNYIYLVVYR